MSFIAILMIFTTVAFSQTADQKIEWESKRYQNSKLSWCNFVSTMDVGPYIKVASDFVTRDPFSKTGVDFSLLMVVNMASEGFSLKPDCKSCSMGKEKLDPQDRQKCEDLCLKKDFEAFVKEKKITKCPQTILKESSSATDQCKGYKLLKGEAKSAEPYSSYDLYRSSYYGDSWGDDGSDTFCNELKYLKSSGLFPKKFTKKLMTEVEPLDAQNHPDILCFERGLAGDEFEVFENEPATRFSHKYHGSSCDTIPYNNRGVGKKDQKGDSGRAAYKTPEVQAFANASMIRSSLDQFKLALSNLKPRSPRSFNQFSEREKVFWTKFFYNAGQGTQSAAYDYLKKLSEKGFLQDEEYLASNPIRPAYSVPYENARYVLDTFSYLKEKSDCSSTISEVGKAHSLEDYFNSEDSSSPKKLNQMKVKQQ